MHFRCAFASPRLNERAPGGRRRIKETLTIFLFGRLEEPFWSTLKEIARTRRATLSELVHFIDDTSGTSNLSSAIRLFVLDYYREKSSAK